MILSKERGMGLNHLHCYQVGDIDYDMYKNVYFYCCTLALILVMSQLFITSSHHFMFTAIWWGVFINNI